MTRGDQASSDPLPYVQVDRAVKPKAAMLADMMQTSRQHALGSLIEWWDLCGDPRALEAVVSQTPEGQEPELVITAEQVERRFAMASGRQVAANDLADLGLLEPRGAEGFRVRGMSRYFAPVKARLRARHAAAVGGRASAQKRRLETGSAQPRRSEDRSTVAQPDSEVLSNGSRTVPERLPNGSRTVPEATSNPSGQRSADSGQYLKEGETLRVPPPEPLELIPTQGPRVKPRKPPDPEAEFERFRAACTPDEQRIFGTWCATFGVELGADWALQKFVRERLKSHTADELCAAIKGHARDPFLSKNPTLRSIFRDASHIAICAKRGAA